MEIGIIGLGRMGANMARRLRRGGVGVAAYNRSSEVTHSLAKETGLVATDTLSQLVGQLQTPRVIWLMLPAGAATEQALDQLTQLLVAGDIIVDGANAYYKDSMRHDAALKAKGIHFVDAGVSGGVWGLDNGYALMVGGEREVVQKIERFIKVLAPAPDKGWHHCGPAGSGHFTKMVHNGIEYGMMQAFAEGLALMKGREDFNLIEEAQRPGELMPVMEDEHGTYIMNSKDLRAVEHVERLAKIGIDSLKIEGRTKSMYYVARTAQVYRKAIDDAVGGKSFDPSLLSALENLASRGYTDGFYQRHHTGDTQNYLRGHSDSDRQQYVGDVVAYDEASHMAEIMVKNRFRVGDRLEIIHPAGNQVITLEHMLDMKGTAVSEAPGSGYRVRIPISGNAEKALVARFL